MILFKLGRGKILSYKQAFIYIWSAFHMLSTIGTYKYLQNQQYCYVIVWPLEVDILFQLLLVIFCKTCNTLFILIHMNITYDIVDTIQKTIKNELLIVLMKVV